MSPPTGARGSGAPGAVLVARPDDVTAEWLTEVLRSAACIDDGCRVISASIQPIGTGQVGDSFRVALTYEGPPGPASVVCKFAASDPDSARTGVASGTYETEVAFYRELASTVDVSVPRCHLAAVEAGTSRMVLVLEDLAPATQGDQLGGATVAQVEEVVAEAARLHGPRWGDPSLDDMAWLRRGRRAGMWVRLPEMWTRFVERYGDRLDSATLAGGRCLVARCEALGVLLPRAVSPIHGDLRLDNVMFHPLASSRAVTILDWQTARLGSGLEDVAYLLGTSFADPGTRRDHERALLTRYHSAVSGYAGAAGFTMDDCWTEYRRHAFGGLVMAIVASTIVGRTDRGDRMFLAMASRSAQMAADLDTADLLDP